MKISGLIIMENYQRIVNACGVGSFKEGFKKDV
jgi:hypothetical protein